MYIRVLIEGNAKWRMLLSATNLIPEDSLWIIQIIMWWFDLISVMCFRITRRHSKTNYFRSTEPRLRRLCTTNRYIIACVKSLRKKKHCNYRPLILHVMFISYISYISYEFLWSKNHQVELATPFSLPRKRPKSSFESSTTGGSPLIPVILVRRASMRLA